MADQLRRCERCGELRHVSYFHVGWRDCAACEEKRRGILQDLGIVTPDQLYAESEERIWRYARENGTKITRLID